MLSYPEDERALEAAVDDAAAFSLGLNQDTERITSAWTDAMAVLAPVLEQIGAAFHQMYNTIQPLCQAAYESAGQPYGPGHQALWR